MLADIADWIRDILHARAERKQMIAEEDRPYDDRPPLDRGLYYDEPYPSLHVAKKAD